MRIKKVILETAVTEKLASFYQNILELPVKTENQDQITIMTGSTELVFIQAKAAGSFYHFAFNIPANKLEEARKWLKARTQLIWMEQYRSDIADFKNWHAKSLYFFDPGENIVELIARFDLDNGTDEAFSSKHFLSMSEIGIVFEDQELENRTDSLLKRYDLSYFAKQPPLPQFKAIGDDKGLFIIVPAKRKWFPTSRPAGIFPISVEFSLEGKTHKLELNE